MGEETKGRLEMGARRRCNRIVVKSLSTSARTPTPTNTPTTSTNSISNNSSKSSISNSSNSSSSSNNNSSSRTTTTEKALAKLNKSNRFKKVVCRHISPSSSSLTSLLASLLLFLSSFSIFLLMSLASLSRSSLQHSILTGLFFASTGNLFLGTVAVFPLFFLKHFDSARIHLCASLSRARPF